MAWVLVMPWRPLIPLDAAWTGDLMLVVAGGVMGVLQGPASTRTKSVGSSASSSSKQVGEVRGLGSGDATEAADSARRAI